VPAAAVIPAPRAYINVVAVKKPVVGFEGSACGCGGAGFGLTSLAVTDRCSSDACGNGHWPKGYSVTLEAASEGLHSKRCARRRHCE